MNESLLGKFPGLTYSQITVRNIEARFPVTLTPPDTQWKWGTSDGAGNPLTFASFNALTMNNSYFYYMDYINVSCTVNEADFIDAIDATTFNLKGFSFLLQRQLQGSNIMLEPFTFGTFRQNCPMSVYFGASRGAGINDQNDVLQFKLNGALSQTPAILLLAVSTITILVQTTIYEISNTKFIGEQFKS